jgi:hypothetical protein
MVGWSFWTFYSFLWRIKFKYLGGGEFFLFKKEFYGMKKVREEV